MSLVGKAPLTVCRTASQGFVQVYAGCPAPEDILPQDAQRLLAEGYLEEHGAPATSDEAVVFDGPPAKSADKATWEAYARHRGFVDAEFDGLKKPELVELATSGTPGGEPEDDGSTEDGQDSDES